MIPREVLERIAPDVPGELVEQLEELEPWEREATYDDPLLTSIAAWCAEFRSALGFELGGGTEPPRSSWIWEELSRATAVGYGIIDWHEPESPEGEKFPIVQNYRLGLAIYRAGPTGRGEPFETLPYRRSLPGRFGDYPLAVLNADFTESAHPRGGRAAAVLLVDGDDVLLTARHVVARKQKGSRVRISCPACTGGCFATVNAKAPGYIDAATLKIDKATCLSAPGRALQPLTCPSKGLAVRNHFASVGGYMQATIKQGFEKPDTVINPVRPRTFMTSEMGIRGDSGSAVSTDPDHGDPALVGVYLGTVDIEVAPGNIKRRGYGLDAGEAMRLFNATLVREFYK